MKFNKHILAKKLRAHSRQLMLFAMMVEKSPSEARIFSHLKNHKKRINETLDQELDKWKP